MKLNAQADVRKPLDESPAEDVHRPGSAFDPVRLGLKKNRNSGGEVRTNASKDGKRHFFRDDEFDFAGLIKEFRRDLITGRFRGNGHPIEFQILIIRPIRLDLDLESVFM